MPYKHLRDKRAYDRRYRRENIMSRHRDRAHLANRRYGSPKLIAADVAAVFANRASCYYCGAPVDGRSGTLEHIDAALGNSKSNLTVACPPCNSGKHARSKSIWLKRLATRGIRHEDLPDSIPVQCKML
ncbi:MAG: HNH endonuclease [Chloroflexi bacterium]|nr:HNH endonuclease [Chloroflexota bacterium]